MKQHSSDIAVVGAGIIGLSVALAAARRGKRVVLFEREASAVGASVRNFGLVIPFAQPPGKFHERALRSREIWLEIAKATRLYHSTEGLLALAYHEDEQRVLEEYLATASTEPHGRRMLTREQTQKLSIAVRTEGLHASMHSPTEVVVDARQAIRRMPDYLVEKYGVDFRPQSNVHATTTNKVETLGNAWSVDEIFVCSGADLHTLYPDAFARSGLQKVKLQMLRTVPQPNSFNLGPALCAGLSFIRYPAFNTCPSLPQLRQRLEHDLPFHVENGIHLLVTQTHAGEITIGDSHHYDNPVNPFDRETVNQAMLDYLNSFTKLPSLEIQDRWHGIYAKHPTQTDNVISPEPGVTIVNGLDGAGMTHAFGLAEEIAVARGW